MIETIINHTADIGVKERAKNLKILFKKCAEKITKLALKQKDKIKKLNKINLSVKSNSKSYEELLHDFLNEIIFYIFVKKIFPCKIIIKSLNIDKIIVLVYYRKIIQGEIIRELKSVTYHNLVIKKYKGGYIAEFVIDI